MTCAILMALSGAVGFGLGTAYALLRVSETTTTGPSDETVWGDASLLNREAQ